DPELGYKLQPKRFNNDSLSEWTSIDKGAFGFVYKAWHEKMGHYVAIKLLNDVRSTTLLNEAKFQNVFSCQNVLRIYGIYEGTPPDEQVKQKGMVMEFMKRGSVKTLCKNLSGPPPFVLACRLIHEVALGMRFLHSEGFLHRDLKPQNVMLSDDLHAKLADFGLCVLSITSSNNQEGTSNQNEKRNAGSFKYMPPEAFNVDYKPQISICLQIIFLFLVSFLCNKVANENRVKKQVCKGQRPTLVDLSKKDTAEMKDFLDLMEKCWEGDPKKRPTFEEITPMVQKMYLKHEGEIHDEVCKVLKKLARKENVKKIN
uniref:Protein kinase domain-containing protein n=1 Tax=Oryzias melastigma TaxID=30732 RepID=A0A3B3C1R6_ORYME